MSVTQPTDDYARMTLMADEWFARRRSALKALSAPVDGVRHKFPTADVIRNPETGVLYVVADLGVSPDDWAGVCRVLRDAGVTGGIGEPMFDAVASVHTWIVG